MATQLTRALLGAMALLLAGCASLSEKSTSPFALKPDGINALDTQTKDDKEEEAWFKSFYGSSHCGVWEGSCAPGTEESHDGSSN